MAKLVSMKRTKDDKRGDKMDTAPAEAIEPDYPWGLVLHLDKDELAKLGVKELPKVGSKLTIQARVTVTRVSQEATSERGGEDRRSVDLQITDLGLGAGGEKEKE